MRHIKTLTRHRNKFNRLQHNIMGVSVKTLTVTQYVRPLIDNDNIINNNNNNNRRDIGHRGNNNTSSTDDTSSKWVVIMSSSQLTEVQSSLLARWPKFLVVLRHSPKGEYIASVEKVCLHLPHKVALEFKSQYQQTSGQNTPPMAQHHPPRS